VPVFRSAPILPDLYRRLTDALNALTDRYEIVFVEDNGGDDSWSVIERLADRDQHVRGIRMSRNYGQHNALLCGIRAARYEVIVTLDDDLQNPPEEIGKLIALLDGGADVAYGTPATEQHGFLPRPGFADHETGAAERDGCRYGSKCQRPSGPSARDSATLSRPIAVPTCRSTCC